MLSRQLYQPECEFTFHTCYMSPLCPFKQLHSSHRMVLTCIFPRTSDVRHLLPILLLSIYFSGKGSAKIYFQVKKYKVFLIVEFWTFSSFVHYVESASMTWFDFICSELCSVIFLFWWPPCTVRTLLIIKYGSTAPLTLFFPKPLWMF